MITTASPGGEVAAGSDGRFMAEVAREPDQLEVLVAPVHLAQQRVARVRAPVVDEDRLGGPVEAIHHRAEASL